MDYKKKYKEALEVIEEILSSGEDSIKMSRLKLRLQPFFPELKKSEDERIRKEIISLISSAHNHRAECKNWIAWLEKQGKQNESVTDFRIEAGKWYMCIKSYSDSCTSVTKGKIYKSDKDGFILDDCDELRMDRKGWAFDGKLYFRPVTEEEISWLLYEGMPEPIEEKKTIVPIKEHQEPKFKIGDWVMYCGKPYQITGLHNDTFTLTSCDGSYFFNNIKSTNEPVFHLWTIQDAKPGDVLAYETDDVEWVLIYDRKEIIQDIDHIRYYALCYDGNFDDEGISAFVTEDYETHFHPATKEQRDLLFQKMKEDDYEWDAEKLELNRIVQREEPKTVEDKAELFASNYDADKIREKPHAAVKEAFESGAQWQREQMMKEVIDGIVVSFPDVEHLRVQLNTPPKDWNYCDKVKFLIIKKG